MRYCGEMEKWHTSVMLNEVIDFIKIVPGGIYADLTFGEGGHSEAMLAAGAGKVIGVDRDEAALERYRASGAMKDDPRLELNLGPFSQLSRYLREPVDGILADLGVSTRQILSGERGFSLQEPGPLDMRMSQDDETVERLLDQISERDLSTELRRNVDLKGANRVARKLKRARGEGRLKGTSDLLGLFGHNWDELTPIFLALRMWVNEELGEVKQMVPQAMERLKVGGRLVLLTFHSTEDRQAKKLFKELGGITDTGLPPPTPPVAKILTRRPIPPSEEEIKRNPRSRSAKLRCVEKLPRQA